MLDLTGRRALVTGGSRGIGAATALLLAECGADVAIAYRSRHDDAGRGIRKRPAFFAHLWVARGMGSSAGSAG